MLLVQQDKALSVYIIMAVVFYVLQVAAIGVLPSVTVERRHLGK